MIPEVEVVRAELERPEVTCAVLAPTEGMRFGAAARVRKALDGAGVRHYSGTRDGSYFATNLGSRIFVCSAGDGAALRGLVVDGVLWVVDGVPSGAIDAALPAVRRGGVLVVAA